MLTDSDNSDAQDGPSDADFWKGPLQEPEEKSRLVWSGELVASKTYCVHSELRRQRFFPECFDEDSDM